MTLDEIAKQDTPVNWAGLYSRLRPVLGDINGDTGFAAIEDRIIPGIGRVRVEWLLPPVALSPAEKVKWQDKARARLVKGPIPLAGYVDLWVTRQGVEARFAKAIAEMQGVEGVTIDVIIH